MPGRAEEADVNNEASVVSSIHKQGGHENIIEVFDHGWLQGSGRVYFIDMELADFTLAEYIAYLGGAANPSIDFDAIQDSSVFGKKACSSTTRDSNALAIANHIAQGLEFLHMHHHVHRDLKPSNG